MARYDIVRPATREAWLALRNEGIGSSEVGVIAGVSRFQTPIGLYLKKKGLTAPEPESSVMAAGHEFEPLVAYRYALETGDVMDPASEGDWLAVSKAKPFLRVSPDRIFWNKDIPAAERTYDNAYIFEAKTTKMSVTPDDFPKSWFLQVQYQMGVMGIKKAVIGWFSYADCLRFGYVEVPFNAVVFAEIERMLTSFWNDNVLAGRMPERVLTNEDAALRWPKEIAEAVSVAPASLEDDVRYYNELSAKTSEMTKQMDDIKVRVKTFMKETSELHNSRGRTIVTWKASKSSDGAAGARRITFKKIA